MLHVVKTEETDSHALAHILALITVSIWGLTFVSTKVLLRSFAPVEILFYRFLIGFLALCILRPHILHLTQRRHELLFIAAGLTGSCLYFLLENIALQYATAGNISVAVSVAPLFTTLVASVIARKRAFGASFIGGFIVAMAGILLISRADLSTDLTSLGDILAVLAAFTWALYSNIINRLSALGYETIATTKRVFAWGILFIVCFMPFMGAHLDFSRFLAIENTGNLLFLGLGASAACFATWGYAVSQLGPTKTSAYIYLSPAITVIAGVVILGEPFSAIEALGIVLVLGGLILSEGVPSSR